MEACSCLRHFSGSSTNILRKLFKKQLRQWIFFLIQKFDWMAFNFLSHNSDLGYEQEAHGVDRLVLPLGDLVYMLALTLCRLYTAGLELAKTSLCCRDHTWGTHCPWSPITSAWAIVMQRGSHNPKTRNWWAMFIWVRHRGVLPDISASAHWGSWSQWISGDSCQEKDIAKKNYMSLGRVWRRGTGISNHSSSFQIQSVCTGLSWLANIPFSLRFSVSSTDVTCSLRRGRPYKV